MLTLGPWAAGRCRFRSSIQAEYSLYYLLKYPPTASEIVAATCDDPRPQVAGAFVMCPMVEGKRIVPHIRSLRCRITGYYFLVIRDSVVLSTLQVLLNSCAPAGTQGGRCICPAPWPCVIIAPRAHDRSSQCRRNLVHITSRSLLAEASSISPGHSHSPKRSGVKSRAILASRRTSSPTVRGAVYRLEVSHCSTVLSWLASSRHRLLTAFRDDRTREARRGHQHS